MTGLQRPAPHGKQNFEDWGHEGHNKEEILVLQLATALAGGGGNADNTGLTGAFQVPHFNRSYCQYRQDGYISYVPVVNLQF